MLASRSAPLREILVFTRLVRLPAHLRQNHRRVELQGAPADGQAGGCAGSRPADFIDQILWLLHVLRTEPQDDVAGPQAGSFSRAALDDPRNPVTLLVVGSVDHYAEIGFRRAAGEQAADIRRTSGIGRLSARTLDRRQLRQGLGNVAGG